MDSDSAAEELYGLDPADFVARRSELVAQARAAGERDLARTLTTLRRPPLAAWLLNQLVRERRDVLDELSGFAERIRSAHRSLAGDQLRALTAERQQVLEDVLTATITLAAERGASVTDAVRQQVRETAEAAIADEGAESAVRSGRLTDVLSYSGFGAVDVTDAVAIGLPRREPRAERPRGPRSVRELPPAAERAATRQIPAPTAPVPAKETVQDAAARRAAAAAAQDSEDLALATAEAATAAGERDDAERVLTEATARLEQLEQAVAQARAAVRAATIGRTTAGRKAERAELRRLALQRRIDRRGR